MVFKQKSFLVIILLLISMAQAIVGYDKGPIVNMTQYPDDYRTLDCW